MTSVREDRLRRFYERDTRHDGTFLVGVRTTGIYCLPSCKARKPRPENVMFFENEREALSVGLRACRRCRPDHFYKRYDPDRESIAGLARALARQPGEYPDVKSLAREAGTGATKLAELVRRHYHTTPASWLTRARLRLAARELAQTERRVLDIALDVGFESSSSFHENFRRAYRISPGAYRRLGRREEFTLQLPEDYSTAGLFDLFGRDTEGRTERTCGSVATKALELEGRPARVEMRFSPRRLRVRVESARKLGVAAWVEAHERVIRMTGLAQDPAPFERSLRRRAGLARLVRGRKGTRIPLTTDLFEGLVWVIVGQQVNLAFASACRRSLIELCGKRAGDDFLCHPTPEAVAGLEYRELQALKFSRGKAEYLIDTARLVAEGRLDLERLLTAPAGEIEETLHAIRGLGVWSVQYLLMRAVGLEDCVPIGDSGLSAALERFFELPGRPDPEETRARMELFAPHRSLATFHLWKSLGDQA